MRAMVLHVVVAGYDLECFWNENCNTYRIQTSMTSKQGWQLTKAKYDLVLYMFCWSSDNIHIMPVKVLLTFLSVKYTMFVGVY